ncbi:transcriptional regulator, Crp/Fnr family [Mariniradius saccharolyticus AK6]|jgi:CRP-like cAMP-binding protein|uniref:Transcriptional regulator, Crp/Fnr family n=2 Tax=Mariniradius TaxID=1245590 RepID=M7XBL3_9BACT|nr:MULTISPECIES: Crp/Fnr family transcriptional regulator [Mariniradius]EMS34805.1 transcriptional regulator, Crp/Fnr family [Mariniradius saccharolyticus AK6]MCF1751934.1 Crp/Fnr family transcriptional regulator [Mariniradius sediminis]
MKVLEKSTPCELCMSRKFSLFANLSEPHLCHLSDHKNFITHKKGQILYYEGTKPLGVFCINDGVVKVFKTASNGKEQIIRLAKKGDFLGYTSLLGEEAYSNSATIIEDAKICFVPKESFLKVLAEDTEFHRRVTKALCHDLGIMEDKLTDATQKSIRERLAFTLLKLSETYGIDGEAGEKIDIVLTREEIAGLVGTATETVIRLLSEFKKDDLIDFQGKKIIVQDKKALARLSDFYG